MAGDVVGRVRVKVTPDTSGFARETRRKLDKDAKNWENNKKKPLAKVPIEVDDRRLEKSFERSIANLNKKIAESARDSKQKMAVQFRALVKTKGGALVEMQRSVARAHTILQGFADGKSVVFDAELDEKPDALAPIVRRGKVVVDDIDVDIDNIRDRFRAIAETARNELADKIEEAFDPSGLSRGEFERLQERAAKALRVTRDLDDEARKLREQIASFPSVDELDKALEVQHEHTKKRLKELREVFDAEKKHYRDARELRAKLERKSGTLDTAELERADAAVRRHNAHVEGLAKAMDRLRESHARKTAALTRDRHAVLGLSDALKELEETRRDLASDFHVDVDWDVAKSVRARGELDRITKSFRKFGKEAGAKGFSKLWDTFGDSLTRFTARTTGVRLLWQTIKDLWNVVPNLDMAIPKIASKMVTLGPIVSGATKLIANAFTVIGDAMKVFNLALAGPATIASAGASLILIARALKDVDKYAPGLKEWMGSFFDIATPGFWKGALTGINNMRAALDPVVKETAPAFGKAWGSAIGALADGFSHGGGKSVRNWIENLTKAVDAAKPGFEAMGEAIVKFVSLGSEHFPYFSKVFNDWMGSLNKWVDTNAANGNFGKWIEEGAKAFQDIVSVGGSAISIMRSFTDIARDAGGLSLDGFTRWMGGVAKFFNDPGVRAGISKPLGDVIRFFDYTVGMNASKLTSVFGQIGKLISQFTLSLGPAVHTMLGSIFDGFSSDTLLRGFKKFFDGMAGFILKVSPGVGKLVEGLGDLLGVVGVAGDSWGGPLNDALLLLADLGERVHPGVESFLKSTGPTLQNVLKNLKEPAEELASAFSNLLQNKGLQEFFFDVFDSISSTGGVALDILTGFVNLLDMLADAYGALPPWAQEFISWSVGLGFIAGKLGILSSFTSLLGTMVGRLGGPRAAMHELGDAFGYLGRKIGDFGKWAGTHLKTLPDKLKTGLGKIGDFAKPFVDKLKKGFGKIGDFLKAVPDKLKGAFGKIGEFFKGIPTKLKTLFGKIKLPSLGGVLGKIGDFFKGIPQAVKNLVGKIKLPSVGGLFGKIGEFFKGIPNALKNMLGKIKIPAIGGFITKWLGKLLGPLLDVLSGPAGWALLIADLIPGDWIADLGNWLLKALGLDDGFVAAFTKPLLDRFKGTSFVGGVVNVVKDWISSSFSMIWDALSGFVTGDFSGFMSIYSDGGGLFGEILRNFWDALGISESQLNDSLSDIESTLQRLREKIIAPFEWAFNGIASAITGVFDWAASLFSGAGSSVASAGALIGGTVSGAFQSAMSAINSGMTVAANVVNGIGSAFGWVVDAVKSIPGKIGDAVSAAVRIVSGLASKVSGLFGGIVDGIAGLFSGAVDFIRNGIESALNSVGLEGLGSHIGRIFDRFANGIRGAFRFPGKVLGDAARFVTKTLSGVGKAFGSALGKVVNIGGDIVDAIKSWADDCIGGAARAIGAVGSWIDGKIDDIVEAVKDTVGGPFVTGAKLFGDAVRWVGDKVDNFVSTAESMWDATGGALLKWGSGLLDGAKWWGPVADLKGKIDSGRSGGQSKVDSSISQVARDEKSWLDRVVDKASEALSQQPSKAVQGKDVTIDAKDRNVKLSDNAKRGGLKDAVIARAKTALAKANKVAWDKLKNTLERAASATSEAISVARDVVVEIEDRRVELADAAKADGGIDAHLDRLLDEYIERQQKAVDAKKWEGRVRIRNGFAVYVENGEVKYTTEADYKAKLATSAQQFADNALEAAREAIGSVLSGRKSVAVGGGFGVPVPVDITSNPAAASLAGSQSGAAFGSGLDSSTGTVVAAAKRVADGAKSSMSVDATPKGAALSSSYAGGILNRMGLAVGNALSVAKNAASSMKSDAKGNGGSLTDSFRSGVKGREGTAKSAALAVATAAKNAMHISASTSGSNVGSTFTSGVSEKRGSAVSMARNVASSAARAMSVSATSAGSHTGGTYASGVSSRGGSAAAAGRGLATRARDATSGVSAYGSGQSIGRSFANGISSMVQRVATAASNLVANARKFLPNSPAKEGPFSGSGWGGWGESIGEEVAKGLRRAAPSVAAEAVALMSGVQSQLSATPQVAVGAEFSGTTAMRRSLAYNEGVEQPAQGNNVYVTVESRTDDAMREGVRFGKDIAWAMEGAGF